MKYLPECTFNNIKGSLNEKRVQMDNIYYLILYILESNPHPFYSFAGLKNQMWNRFACGLDSQLRA
jgi:hypothetical protein